jgi:hypothetical protein
LPNPQSAIQNPQFLHVPKAGHPVRRYKAFRRLTIATHAEIAQISPMPRIELSPEVHAALVRLAAAKNLAPDELLALLLDPSRPALAGDTLLFHLASAGFTSLTDPTERYLALLGWCARNYACDFADFISHQESGRHYLAWNRDEINEARARNQARQIEGTQFWAVMTIDAASKRRFVRRMLEFIGCHDETVTLACRSLADDGASSAKSA